MTESILQIKDLKKSFGDNEILKGISLDVKQGEVVVILGSSGCGKSTIQGDAFENLIVPKGLSQILDL